MLRFIFGFLLSAVIIAVVAALAVTAYVVPGLPDTAVLRDVRMQVPLRVYTGDGRLIAEFGEQRRIPLRIDEIPQQMIQAVLASEDDRFYEHPGVDWQGILRAALKLALTGEKKQGGSTITMQVARHFFLSRERTYIRKIREMFLALKIEREFSKDEILALYLNAIYLGQRAYGVGAAAQIYYGREARDLTLPQIATIAGLPSGPSIDNPVSNRQRALLRREYVLQRMLEENFITQDEYATASVTPETAVLHSADVEVDAPWVAELARQQVLEDYGEDAYTAGYRVYTTVVGRNQLAANQAVRQGLLDYDVRHGWRGAELHLDEKRMAGGDAEWQRALADMHAVAGLQPALITAVGEKSASAWLAGIGPVDIPWEGLSWARKYLSENARGPAPAKAADVLQVGDVVRLIETGDGAWRLSQIPVVEGALVSLRPDDGAVLALVGGFDFARSKFDRATQAMRQPGSSFKPFIYSAALAAGYTPASVVNDAPVVIDDPSLEEIWRPENFTGKFYGPTRLREALAHSRNLVSIRLLHSIGVETAIPHLEKFGFDPQAIPHNLSLALGTLSVSPWQLASAYAVLANGGYRVDPYLIERIDDEQGTTVYRANPAIVCRSCDDPAGPAPTAAMEATAAPTGPTAAPSAAADQPAAVPDGSDAGPRIAPRAVDEQNVWILNSMTRDVIAIGTGRRALALNRADLSGKTGTTNEHRDAWFAGYNPTVVTVTWIGFDKFSPLGGQETGSQAALPMWIDYTRVALDGVPETWLDRPEGLVMQRIDKRTGRPIGADSPDAVFEVFQEGSLPVATDTGLPANPVEPLPQEVRDQLF
jgi:penicillin-binding protein 1A